MKVLLKTILKLTTGILLFGVLAASASADIVTIASEDKGWYTSEGTHHPELQNFIVGFDANETDGDTSDDFEYRNWFTFDLSSVSDIESATLRVWLPDPPAEYPDRHGYKSPDEFEIYALYDITTSMASLKDGSAGISAFNDLADGAEYGFAEVFFDMEGSFVEIELSYDAIEDMNAAAGLWGVGGMLDTRDYFEGYVDEEEKVFRWTSADSPVELVVSANPVPVPAGVWLLGSGLLGVFMTRRESIM